MISDVARGGKGADHDLVGARAAGKLAEFMKILLVDDDELFLEFAAAMLRAGDNDVETCASASQAIARLGVEAGGPPADPFDAILIDIVMPEVSGPELCSLIRAHPAYRDTPIIMISATRDMSLIDQALTAGGSSYIQKPIQAATFAAEIQSKVDEARAA